MKKILVLLLSVVVSIISVMPVSMAETAEAGISVDEERADFLVKMDAIYYSEAPENLARNVTRGEFAKILVKYFKYQSMMTAPTKKPYVDVELDNEYVREIKVLKDCGFVIDDEKLKFRPDSYITISEASVMLAAALGYKDFGTGVLLNVKNEIIKDIPRKAAATAVLDDIYAMLENCFNIEMMPIGGWTSNSGINVEKKTVMERLYHAIHKRGIVTANSVTGLSVASDATISKTLKIDNMVYNATTEDFDKYLGYMVDYYIKDNSDDELLYVVPYKKNKTIKVDSDDVESAADYRVKYCEGSRWKSVELDSNFDVIYNKKAYVGYGALDSIVPEDGEMLFLDNNNDNKYDTVFVTAYEHYIVQAIDTTENVVVDYITSQKIDLSDDGQTVEIYDSVGDRVSITGIRKDNALTVVASKNTDGDKIVSVYITDKPMTGMVRTIGQEKITVDDTEYKWSGKGEPDINAGESGYFYLTKSGKIFYCKKASVIDGINEWNIGLVYKIGFNQDEEIAYVTLFTPEGEFIRYIFNEKVRVNKTTAQSGGKGHNVAYNSANKGDVVRYKLNSDKEIIRFEPADRGIRSGGNSQITYEDEYSLRRIKYGDTITHLFGVYDSYFGTDKDTIWFVIPEEEDWTNKRLFATSYKFPENKGYPVAYEMYMYDEFKIPIADVIVIRDSSGSSNSINKNTSVFFTISDIVMALYDDEVVYRISGIQNTAKASFMCKLDEFEKYNISEGDVIWLEKKSSGFASCIQKVYNTYGNNTEGAEVIYGVNHVNNIPSDDYGRIEYGEVIAADGGFLLYKIPGINGASETTRLTSITTCKFTKIDVEEQDVVTSKAEELLPGTKILVGLKRGIAFDVVVIKG